MAMETEMSSVMKEQEAKNAILPSVFILQGTIIHITQQRGSDHLGGAIGIARVVAEGTRLGTAVGDFDGDAIERHERTPGRVAIDLR